VVPLFYWRPCCRSHFRCRSGWFCTGNGFRSRNRLSAWSRFCSSGWFCTRCRLWRRLGGWFFVRKGGLLSNSATAHIHINWLKSCFARLFWCGYFRGNSFRSSGFRCGLSGTGRLSGNCLRLCSLWCRLYCRRLWCFRLFYRIGHQKTLLLICIKIVCCSLKRGIPVGAALPLQQGHASQAISFIR